jgi:signal transduction histidine kinase
MDWLRPRATDRDVAFREQIIRSTLAIILILGLLSLVLNIFVFQEALAPISYISMHLVFLAGCAISAIQVTRGHVLSAGWTLVLMVLFAANALILLMRQDGLAIGGINGIAGNLFVPLIATLVLPRTLIIPTAVLTVITYALSQFVLPVSNLTAEGVTLVQQMSFAVPALLAEGALLRQLRVEFDERLRDMRASIQVAEAAKQDAEEARQRAELDRQRAEDADKAKTQFLANMSHELRTPLNAIIGYDEVMLGGMVGTFSPKQTDLLQRIQHNSRRLLALINDILDLSKIEAGSAQIYQTPITPRKIITETVESLRSLAQAKDIGLSVQLEESVPEVVLGDAAKIQQILVNLVSNAIKFTDEGGVLVSAEAVGTTHWKLSVQDSGIGIPPESIDTIFEPFKQVDSSDTRRQQGTGLGLSIVKRLIEMMGGSIDVETELGHGSTFTIVLPRMGAREKTEETAAVQP